MVRLSAALLALAACATAGGDNNPDRDAAGMTPDAAGTTPDAGIPDAPPDAAPPCVEGDVHTVDPGTGHCYIGVAEFVSWDTANAACEGFGAHLATIFDSGENAFVHNFASDANGNGVEVWLGATDNDLEGTFVWVTGERLVDTFENWNGGEPNNSGGENCLEMRADGLWNDKECGTGLQYVCERP